MEFNLSKKETARYLLWLKLHNETCSYGNLEKQGAIGGQLSFKFTPTSLGVVKIVACTCGAALDLTPYDEW